MASHPTRGTFSLRGHLTRSGTFWVLVVTPWSGGLGAPLASSGWRPGMVLNTEPCTGQPHTTNKLPAQRAVVPGVRNPAVHTLLPQAQSHVSPSAPSAPCPFSRPRVLRAAHLHWLPVTGIVDPALCLLAPFVCPGNSSLTGDKVHPNLDLTTHTVLFIMAPAFTQLSSPVQGGSHEARVATELV